MPPTPLSLPVRKISIRLRREWLRLRRPSSPASMDHGKNAGHEEERGEGGENQPTDYCAAKRRILLAAFAEAHGHRHHSNDHCECGHQYRPDAHETGFASGIHGALTLIHLLAREGNHQDAVGRRYAYTHDRAG